MSILGSVGTVATLAPELQASQAGFLPESKRREKFLKTLGGLSSLASLHKFKFGAILAISGATVPTVANIDTFDPGLIFLVKYIYIPWSPSVWAH